MDGGDREAFTMKELVQRVGSTLRFHEDQGPRGLGKSHYEHEHHREHELENGNFGASIRLFNANSSLSGQSRIPLVMFGMCY